MIRILEGDALAVLKTLESESVNTCVTSPPYFGLRDYGMAGQIGLEQTPQEFIARLVDVFREVRRVLRKDGTAWVNMGDSYAGSGKGGNPDAGTKQGTNAGSQSVGVLYGLTNIDKEAERARTKAINAAIGTEGYKPKDLMGMPWRLAFALQEDGWYLRQDIIWSKPNPMPESVTDRCTKAHEYLFLLSKSSSYYYDQEAIKEPVAPATIERLSQDVANQVGSDRVPGKTNGPMKAVGHIPGNKSHKGTTAYLEGDDKQRTKAGLVEYAERQRSKRDSFKRDDSKRAEAIPGQSVGTHRPDRKESEWDTGTRNKRSVWTVATQPFKEAHFATFPPALIEPCILAGCPAGGVVLDPFGGAGTTGLVADRLQRDAILIELNPAYAVMARNRIQKDSPLFAEVA